MASVIRINVEPKGHRSTGPVLTTRNRRPSSLTPSKLLIMAELSEMSTVTEYEPGGNLFFQNF